MFIFGEAEKGEFCKPLLCRTPIDLLEKLGNPPPESRGILLALQALLYQRDLIFYRVEEEGFSEQDYWQGLRFLQKNARRLSPSAALAAICMPGMGDAKILEAGFTFCKEAKTILLTDEQDFYDYLTSK